jgi:hypothetical protein
MDEPRAQRTLVKSPPELWAEISDGAALAGHLEAFGDIRITRLEPETTVAWEGDRARGTVELEPAGWGTKVTLTAQLAPAPGPPDRDASAGDPPAAPEAVQALAPEAPTEEAPSPQAPTAEAPSPQAPTEEAPSPQASTEEAPSHRMPTDEAPEPARAAAPQASPAPRRRGFPWRLFGRRRHGEPPASAPDPAAPRSQAPPQPAADAEPPRSPVASRPEPEPEAEPAAPAPAAPAAAAPAPVAPDPAAPDPAPSVAPAGPTSVDSAPLEAGRAEAVLVGVLDDLGAARHRPFSRG